jgi:hypothetical protein
MDPKIYEALRQAVSEGLTRNTLEVLALTAVISIACAYVIAYWKRRAENLATKDDFKSLKAQLEENTTLTETIKQGLSKKYSLWQKQRDFKRKQIEEFYSPLLFLVQRNNFIQSRCYERLQISEKEHGGKRTEEWVEILKFFMDGYILPLRDDIAERFKTKSFLMEEEPESFTQFLQHDAENRPLAKLWSEKKIDGIITAADWPEKLEDDIRRTKERLERELRELLGLPVITRAGDSKTTATQAFKI